MNEALNEVYNILMNIINNSSVYGPILAAFLILVESIIPVLPLFVFITIVFIAYGYVGGFIISYLLTSLGCFLAFFLWRKILKKQFKKYFRQNTKCDKLMKKIDKFDFSTLILLIALPFTPAFLVNIAASLSEMNFKKFSLAILVGKLSIVFFWGVIGTSLVESLKNPKILLIIIVMLGITYIMSKLLLKIVKLD